MGRVPLLLPLLGMLAGIIAGREFPAHSLLFIVISFIAALCSWLIHRHTVAVFSLFIGIGKIVMMASSVIAPPLPEGVHQYDAAVISVSDESGSRRIKCRASGVGVVSIRLYGALPIVREGNQISFRGELTPYQALQPIVPDELVYEQTDVVAEGVVTGSELTVTNNDVTLRRRIMDLIIDSGVNDRTGAMLCSLLIGETELLDRHVRSGFSAAGISHVLALSGLHVGVITMLITLALWPLYVGRHNRTRRALTIAVLWGFAALTGFSPSVTRAVIMASVYYFGRIIERPGVPMNSLCLAAIIILVMSPESLWTVSFQLSFAAVAGILIFYPIFNPVDRRNHPWLHKVIGYPAVSLSAMIFTGILSAYYFHSYPLFFLIANLAISPIIPLIICGGAILVAFSVTGLPVEWLCSSLDWLTAACCRIAELIEAIPGHSATGLYFSPMVILPAFAALLMLALGIYRKRMFPVVAAVAFVILTFQTKVLTAANFPQYEHYFLRDHTATNILVRCDDKLYLLTSAESPGVQNDMLERSQTRFSDYMNRRGIGELHLCPDTLLTPYASRKGAYFSLDGKRYLFLTHNNQRPGLRVDYLVVSRGFTEDVVRAAQTHRPDSAVILSSALNKRRLTRYAKELDTAKIKYFTY